MKSPSLAILKNIPKDMLKKKRVLVRVDFNVPLSESLQVKDDTRIRAASDTVEYLLACDCIIILISHLGRPNGNVVESMRLDPVARSLESIMQRRVVKLNDCIGDDVKMAVDKLISGDIVLLENLRFHKEEESNNPIFAQQLASLADIYVNDAFGAAHRAHASTVGVTTYLPSFAGFLMAKEIKALDRLIVDPERPFISIIGGAKISGKIEILERLTEISDKLLIGGGMAYTFIAAQGFEIGKSIWEYNQIDFVKRLMAKIQGSSKKIIIPTDVHVSGDFSINSESRIVPIAEIGEHVLGMDIGEKTIDEFKKIIDSAKTVFWNGPLGVFEMAKFARGTNEIAKKIASIHGKVYSVIGGGDSISAVNKLGLASKFSHISTGGGASLEYVAGRELPGIEVLRK
ncbi:MAG: phosphoglycerate kinase [Candidatus Atribacteria bacterium]|jgi:phosphoglycerate kinase|nr:phosphoglycerate kinase [Candidatus Atribacteria bacterium]